MEPMTDAELGQVLSLPRDPCTGTDILEHISATDDWQVERVLGSAGTFVVEVCYRPVPCRAHILCRPVDAGLYAVEAVVRAGAEGRDIGGAGTR